jgi:hypothetical protein
LWIAFAPLAIRMFRNMPLLVIATLPATIQALPAGALLRALRVPERAARLATRAALAAAALGAVLLCARVATDAYYVASRRPERFGLAWNPLDTPIAAAEYARRAQLPGRMLNHLNFGGYLMWALREPVFIDGRLEVVGEAFYAEYLRALASDEALEAEVARRGVGWIVFPYVTNPTLHARLSASPRWRLAYVDHLAAIFVRNGPDAARYVDPALGAWRASAEWPALVRRLPGIAGNPRPSRIARWARGLAERQRFPTLDAYMGLFHYYRGEIDLAGGRYVAALGASGGDYYEIYNNLGSALLRSGHLAEARDCSLVVLEDSPGNRLALERLAVIARGGG